MKKLIVLLLLFSYATLSEAFVSETKFFTCLFEIYQKKTSMEYYFFSYNYLAQKLIYWYEVWCTNSCSLQDNFRNCSKVNVTLNRDEHD